MFLGNVDYEPNDQVLSDTANSSQIDQLTSSYFTSNASDHESTQEETFLNKLIFIVVNEVFNFSNFCFDHLNNLAAYLETLSEEAPFETKILIALLCVLASLFILILIFGKIYGKYILKFEQNPG